MALRAWQKEALEAYRQANPRDFTVTATPGAGKTTFAFTIMEKLLSVKQINQIVVVVPTDHLRKQWADSGIDKGVFLDPSLSNQTSLLGDDFVGYVVTYAQVASNPGIHMRRVTQQGKRTMVVFDEIHHAGDGLSWGEATRLAFSGAARRLTLTGTPFRTSGKETIPFVKYETQSDGTQLSMSDYTYGYREALEDHVVRPVSFAAYSGQSKWSNSAGETFEATLLGEDLSKAQEQAAWRTALASNGKWIPHVFAAANDRLDQIRAAGMSDAAGMILASDQDSARAYARVLKRVTGVTPVVILSDDNKASRKITAFSESTSPEDKWLIAVRMVSEGVDVPRLAVGVWATNYRTPLFFAQAVGRFVRARRKGEVATVFLPAVRPLLALAAGLEEQRNHIIAPPKDSEDLLDPITEEEEQEQDNERNKTIYLESSALFAHVLYNGKAHVGGPEVTEEDQEYLGLPGLLSPDQMAAILRKRDTELRRTTVSSGPEEEESETLNPFLAVEVRKDVNRLVSRLALKRGVPHAQIHTTVRRAVAGPPTGQAPYEILLKRREWLEEKLL